MPGVATTTPSMPESKFPSPSVRPALRLAIARAPSVRPALRLLFKNSLRTSETICCGLVLRSLSCAFFTRLATRSWKLSNSFLWLVASLREASAIVCAVSATSRIWRGSFLTFLTSCASDWIAFWAVSVIAFKATARPMIQLRLQQMNATRPMVSKASLRWCLLDGRVITKRIWYRALGSMKAVST